MRIHRPLNLALCGTLLALAASFLALHGNARREAPFADAAPAAMRDHAGPAASAPVLRSPGITIRIAVTPESAAPAPVYRFHKNDRVNFHVLVPCDGMLAIHGYTGDVPITANRELALPIKLEHTGRFPMHVHAHGGQHIEVAVLEILPD